MAATLQRPAAPDESAACRVPWLCVEPKKSHEKRNGQGQTGVPLPPEIFYKTT